MPVSQLLSKLPESSRTDEPIIVDQPLHVILTIVKFTKTLLRSKQKV